MTILLGAWDSSHTWCKLPGILVVLACYYLSEPQDILTAGTPFSQRRTVSYETSAHLVPGALYCPVYTGPFFLPLPSVSL